MIAFLLYCKFWGVIQKEVCGKYVSSSFKRNETCFIALHIFGGNAVITINDNGWWISFSVGLYNWELSWWQHWPHWRLSLWQPLVLPVTKFTSKQYSRQWQYRSLLWRFRRWRQNWRHYHLGLHCTSSLSGWIRAWLRDKTQGLATFDDTHSLAIFLYPFHQGHGCYTPNDVHNVIILH